MPARGAAAGRSATREAFEAWAGGTVEEVEVGPLDERFEAFRVVQAAEAWRAHGAWVTAHPDAVGPGVRERFAIASEVTGEQEASARAQVERLRAQIRDDRRRRRPRAADHPAALLPPRTASAAELDRSAPRPCAMTALAGIGGLPALTVPALTCPAALGPHPSASASSAPAAPTSRWSATHAPSSSSTEDSHDPPR